MGVPLVLELGLGWGHGVKLDLPNPNAGIALFLFLQWFTLSQYIGPGVHGYLNDYIIHKKRHFDGDYGLKISRLSLVVDMRFWSFAYSGFYF